jgi:hypothetical protein
MSHDYKMFNSLQEFRRRPRTNLQPPRVQGHRGLGRCLFRHRQHRKVFINTVKAAQCYPWLMLSTVQCDHI